ncbi:amidase [Robbsia andropogonis]|uniref:Amidase n=1 Tax=Robbsia andropogonis TaxID=28092 RepID=A0A0F5K594_9BURK|nr:amidase [Robbsia andropogonis]KKB64712.1 amidase [Robbsia andropogonis]MCP1117919.1 amidase [Robbsia andropogonis]MCP1127384.1 amidase [Robbsia andropogonis]
MTTAFDPKTPIAELANALARGDTTSRALTEIALERIAAAGGNGAHAFVSVDADGARAQADAIDTQRKAGRLLSPLAGLPVSVKDLFDVAGQPTRAGSAVLADAAPATSDAEVVSRLRAAGAVLIGRSNMSEFAFSGLGMNPHFGSPASPWRPHERRVSGGSSSGAAVSVAEGMAAYGLGTDTGGSLRIPAAFCGVTGFKPSANRIPGQGAIPLSMTLDSFGAIAPTVQCCAIIDQVLAGAPERAAALALQEPIPSGKKRGNAGARAADIAGRRFAIVTNVVMEGVEPEVERAFEAALARLSNLGADLVDMRFDALDRLTSINKFGFSPIEAWWYHRDWVATRAASYDARVLARIRIGETASAADYLDLLAARRAVIAEAAQAFAGYDAILMPTAPMLPPQIDDLKSDAAFFAANGRALRNPSIINFIDGCALSIPAPAYDDAPVGLMVAGLHGQDAEILAVGESIEAGLNS